MLKRSATRALALALTLASPAVVAQPAPAPAKPNEEKPKPPAAPPAEAPAAKPPADAKPPVEAKPTEAPGAEAEEEEDEESDDAAPEPAPQRPADTQAAPQGPPSLTPLPMWPEPDSDTAALKKQGSERPGAAKKSEGDRVFAEDWWSHARPILEFHGYFRVRAELFHRFWLGRVEEPAASIWPRPADNRYFANGDAARVFGPASCTADEAGNGSDDNPENANRGCGNRTQAGANMRFRLAPELHVSDNLRVLSQIDLLDNLVLGSTPNGYANEPAASTTGGYAVAPRNGYAPIGAFDDTQKAPASAINSVRDSIQVKRAWAEYATPVGEARFGRMPHHWGLGMLYNSGDGYDDDYATTVDRLSFVTGIKALDLYFSGAWDFPNEGATSDNISLDLAQPYDVAQLDDVDQYMLSLARKKSPELTRLALARGDLVLNGGIQVIYRTQLLESRSGGGGTCTTDGAAALGCQPGELDFVRRGYSAWIPDVWFQLLYRRFRFEIEAATIQGSIDNVDRSADLNLSGDPGYDIEQWGIATQIEQKLVEDKLRLGFDFGFASGDSGVDSLNPPQQGFQPQVGDRTISTFRFHPSYHLDLILYRNILTRVQGTYYFRPSVNYDFVRDLNGQKIGGGIAAIWSRASEFMQAPGHEYDLGIELNAALYYQSKDGALNDDPGQMGGFFAKLEYGALFPMAGLGYPDKQAALLNQNAGREISDTSMAQIVRLYLGVLF